MRKDKLISCSTTINFGSFPGKAVVSIGYSFEELKQQMKRERLKHWLIALEQVKEMFLENNNCGFVSKRTLKYDGKDYIYYFLVLNTPFDKTNSQHYITLAHEIIHLATYVMTPLLDIVEENESFAYTHSHMMNQICELINTKA